MRSILEQVKDIAHGTVAVKGWLGAGGEVVDEPEAQRRADICAGCPCNVKEGAVTDVIADAIRFYLELKNKVGLKVKGEDDLGVCSKCGCQVRLLVHEPLELVHSQLLEGENQSLPDHCWKKDLTCNPS